MAVTRFTVRTAAKVLAQDPAGRGLGGGIGVQLLLSDPTDYDLAITQALRLFDQDKPNQRIVDQVLASAGFRFPLSGGGALSGLTGLDAWIEGASFIADVWFPWDVADQGQTALERNTYRLVKDPGPVSVLELLEDTAGVGDQIRLAFTAPHVLTDAPNTVANPTAAPTTVLAAPAAPGNVDNGTHSYVYAWTTLHGDTKPSPAAAAVTVTDKATNGQIRVTVPASADPGITGAKIYRTIAGDTGTRKLVGTLTSSTGGGIFTDNVADASLGASVVDTNTAGGQNTVLDGDGDAIALLAAAVILELAAVKAVQNTGNTGLPNDVVDRRNQSDIFKSRSKEFRDLYRTIVGATDEGPAGASGWADLDISLFGPLGGLWHGKGTR